MGYRVISAEGLPSSAGDRTQSGVDEGQSEDVCARQRDRAPPVASRRPADVRDRTGIMG
jgi:hypothetical protein